MLTRRISWGLLLALGLAAGVRAAEPSPGDALAVLRAFFGEADAAKRADLAAKFAAVAPTSWDEVRSMLHRAAPRPALEPGREALKTPGDEHVGPIGYVLRVPRGYRPDAPQGWPLIISAHGTGGSGEKAVAFMEGVLGPDVEKYLVAGPDSPQPGVYQAGRVTTDYPLHVLADVRRRANVDSDRCILAGYSRGGYTTWGTVLFSPGEWAGALPMASWPLTEAGSDGAVFYLENVLNLPIQAHWGAKDIEAGQTEGINTLSRDAAAELKRLGAKHFTGIEYAGQGHGLKLEADRIRAFAASVRREPFPADGKLTFHRLYQGRAWYVRATAAARPEFDFRKRRVLRIARKEDLAKAKHALWLREAYQLTVRLPQGRNLIAVFAKNLKEVEVDLPAERLDFARPITITLNGRTARTVKAEPDWPCLLETARATYDFERLIAGRVRLAVKP